MRILFRIAVTSAALLCASAQAFPIAAPGSEGFLVIAGGGEVVATYQGNSAAYSNDLYLENTGAFLFNNHSSPVGSTVSLGTFAAGTELIFRLHVNNTGEDYFTGPASRNPDSQAHARVQTAWAPDEALVSFEDLFNGPFDYNDLSFSFTNVVGTVTPPGGSVPEPSTAALAVLAALGLVSGARRRRA